MIQYVVMLDSRCSWATVNSLPDGGEQPLELRLLLICPVSLFFWFWLPFGRMQCGGCVWSSFGGHVFLNLKGSCWNNWMTWQKCFWIIYFFWKTYNLRIIYSIHWQQGPVNESLHTTTLRPRVCFCVCARVGGCHRAHVLAAWCYSGGSSRVCLRFRRTKRCLLRPAEAASTSASGLPRSGARGRLKFVVRAKPRPPRGARESSRFALDMRREARWGGPSLGSGEGPRDQRGEPLLHSYAHIHIHTRAHARVFLSLAHSPARSCALI